VKWSHDHGFKSREQAHGAPANLLDLYASADVPETETFGSSNFPIPGFRADPNPGHGKPEPMISRFASSAAHVAGRPYASSETLTWLREHFNVALSQCKPEVDQVFLAGINRVYFHGSCYSPTDAAWPGWLFYASTEFNSRNTIWRDLPAMNAYIARCQSILQGGSPDNDVLVYWPIYDQWNDASGMEKRFAMSPSRWANESPCAQLERELIQAGYAFDLVSDRQLNETKFVDGRLRASGGAQYRVLVVPPCDRMPAGTLHQIVALIDAGATVIFQSHLPGDVPGLGNLEQRRAQFQSDRSRLARKEGLIANGAVAAQLAKLQVRREAIADSGVGFIRRRTDGGHDYFLANLTGKALDSWVPLGSTCQSAAILDPLSGRGGVAATRAAGDATEVYVQLQPGDSRVLRCFENRKASGDAWPYLTDAAAPVPIAGTWQIDFIDGSGGSTTPAAIKTEKLASWTTLGDDAARTFAGTARYRIEFDLPAAQSEVIDWQLNLGDVRESARVKVNGQDAGVAWSLPFTLNVGRLLKPGARNVLELEVTNLAANCIRDLDKRGAKWKAFHEINYVDIHYKKFDASNWELVDSGLLGPVTLRPMRALTMK
jgi:hypothetical protein